MEAMSFVTSRLDAAMTDQPPFIALEVHRRSHRAEHDNYSVSHIRPCGLRVCCYVGLILKKNARTCVTCTGFLFPLGGPVQFIPPCETNVMHYSIVDVSTFAACLHAYKYTIMYAYIRTYIHARVHIYSSTYRHTYMHKHADTQRHTYSRRHTNDINTK